MPDDGCLLSVRLLSRHSIRTSPIYVWFPTMRRRITTRCRLSFNDVCRAESRRWFPTLGPRPLTLFLRTCPVTFCCVGPLTSTFATTLQELLLMIFRLPNQVACRQRFFVNGPSTHDSIRSRLYH